MLVLLRVLAALSLCFLFGGVCPAAERHRHVKRHSPTAAAAGARRDLRRERLIVELRLLEVRKKRLECVRRALARGGTRPLDPETCDNLFQ
jgi:hypothetical protein